MFIPSKNQPERHLSSCRKPTVHSASMTVAEATGIKAFFTSESAQPQNQHSRHPAGGDLPGKLFQCIPWATKRLSFNWINFILGF